MSQPVTPRQAPVVLSHVTLRYDSGTQALDDVTLQITQGEHLCVLGANGSGKSTLASVICGLLAPDDGMVTLVGEPVFDASNPDPIDFGAYKRARRNLGLVFQNPDDQLVTTVVEEDVAFGPENLQLEPAEIGRRVERELRRVAMTPYAKADPTRLSGGQKQRVAIAGALAMEPQVLVLDEPGSLLDVRGREAIMRVMGRLRDTGTTIVHITHFMEEALAADRVIVLDHGRIVLEGVPNEVFSKGEELAKLGLEEPFVARLARGLDLPWTCDESAIEHAILSRTRSANLACAVRAQPPAEKEKPHLRSRTAPSTTALEAQHVSFAYRGGTKALDDVTLRVASGSSVAIVGQTGSGKSTLLRLLCALEVPDEGYVTVGGIRTTRKRDRRRIHGTVGYVMQHPERQLFANTVWEDVAFGPTNLGFSPVQVKERCRRALDLVGLRWLDDASPFELSGGQQRLCAIAGILAMEPTILVMDEPTAGLDPRGRRELWHILDDVRTQGVTLLQVTHSMDDAARADQVIVLDQARVLLHGSPAEVFCPQNEETLVSSGLGLPQPLAWARRLERDGTNALGEPLTLEELLHNLTNNERTPLGERHDASKGVRQSHDARGDAYGA